MWRVYLNKSLRKFPANVQTQQIFPDSFTFSTEVNRRFYPLRFEKTRLISSFLSADEIKRRIYGAWRLFLLKNVSTLHKCWNVLYLSELPVFRSFIREWHVEEPSLWGRGPWGDERSSSSCSCRVSIDEREDIFCRCSTFLTSIALKIVRLRQRTIITTDIYRPAGQSAWNWFPSSRAWC